MKIVQALGWFFPDHVGGTEVYVAELSRRLTDAGHEVAIVAPTIASISEQRYDFKGIPVYRFPVPNKASRAEAQGSTNVRGTERFAAWLRDQRPDWVHFHSFSSGLSLAELETARNLGARLLATNHLASLGFICQRGTLMRWGESLCDGIAAPIKCGECLLQQRGLSRGTARLLARLSFPLAFGPLPTRFGSALNMPELVRHSLRRQRRMLELVEKFVVLNQWAADAVRANGASPDKVVLNRLGIANSSFPRKPGPPQKPTGRPVKVGYFGRINHLKGVLTLAEAFARLPRDLDITLEFCGPIVGAEEESLLEQIKQVLSDDPRTRFRKQVAHSEAAALLASYDVLCIPSIWFENGPTVMLEALAVGTPVIGTTIGAMPETIQHEVNGWLATPGDVKGLSLILERVSRDPEGTIDQWRSHLPQPRTMDEVAADYLEIYQTK